MIKTLRTGALLTVLALAGTFGLDPYRNFQLAVIAAYLCAVAGLTILIGLSGQLSLGHAALMACGGYGYALAARAATEAGLTGGPRFAIGMITAVVVAGVFGLVLGCAAARLHGPYLAGLTLALVIALPAVTTVGGTWLGGDQGLQIPYGGVPRALAMIMVVEQWQAWVAVLCTGVVLTGLAVVRRSRLGLAMRAGRADETGARLAGVPVARTKIIAFVLSAMACGVGGALLCFTTSSVSPGAYSLGFSLLLVVAAVIGGLGSLGGAAIGAALVVLLPWLIGVLVHALPVSSTLEQRLAGNLSLLLFGVLLIIVTAARPAGLVGLLKLPRRRPAPAPTIATIPTTETER